MLFSEPKIPQSSRRPAADQKPRRFSALQRAENSSIEAVALVDIWQRRFQCSSASRKFLKPNTRSSTISTATVSVLFSEPKIPQFAVSTAARATRAAVSVLFSEPKIPQSEEPENQCSRSAEFQCSSASRKFLKVPARRHALVGPVVSVLFSEPKIPQYIHPARAVDRGRVSVLFSEPKIPQPPCRRRGCAS